VVLIATLILALVFLYGQLVPPSVRHSATAGARTP